MALVAFMQAGSTSVYAGSWRHPATEHGYLDASYYAKIGRQLEEGCFDLMFFDDRLAMPGIYGGSVADAVKYGARPVKLDLSIVLGVLAQATSHIGLGATGSTTYYTPFHIARTFATLDHLSRGRAAWNIVTSVNDSEAQNFGLETHLGHDARYDRAEEFLEATVGLWDTWEDDAILHDRVNGIYADPDKVHELNHVGEFFSVRGPLTVPRTPQGRPVLIQAGSSGRGREFASRWADLIFTGDPGIEVARNHYADQKERIDAAGRDPQSVKLCPMAYAVVGETEDHAKEREQVFLNDLVHPMASLTLLSELMNYDFAKHDLDDPITDELIESVSGIRGLVQNLRAHIGDKITAARPGRPPSHPAAGPAFRRHRDAGRRSDGGVVQWRRLRRVRLGRNASAGRVRRRGADGDSGTAAPRPVPRLLQRVDAARSPRVATAGLRARRSMMLEGIRVLDVATLAAAPLAATYLGEFGADVIKIEQPDGGDPIRTWGNQVDGVGLMWKSLSRNKRSITLNLRVAEGQALLRRLVEHADVVIVNTRPATLRKWGLDYPALRAVNDKIVMLHITGYGLTGPKSERPGFGTLGEAMSGFANITGEAGGPPTLPPFMLADGVASLNAAYAVMMALYHRDVHGAPGQLIDINLIDPLARLLEQTLLGYDQLGLVPTRAGNRWDISAPRNTYRTADDRWLAMSGSSPQLALRVFRAIGRADLVDDADFSDPQRRLARAREVDQVVADWVATKTLAEAMDDLRRRRGGRRTGLRHHRSGCRRAAFAPRSLRQSRRRRTRRDDRPGSGSPLLRRDRSRAAPRPADR